MRSKLTTLAIVLLACMNVLTFVYATQTNVKLSSIDNLQKTIEDKTNKVIVYQGKDGYTPVKGLDYFDVAAGISAMSYSITNTVIKEVPIMGPQGPAGVDGSDGKDAPFQQLRVNPDTGDIESKYDNQRFWEVLIPCSEVKVGCTQP